MKTTRSLLGAIALASMVASPVQADALIVIGDVSESSPILGDDAFLSKAAKEVAAKLRVLPLGSKVELFYVGDDKVRTETKLNVNVQRITNAEGAPAAKLAQAFPEALLKQVEKLKLHAPHKESHLTTAFADGVKLCLDYEAQKGGRSRAERCEIVMLSDGLQFESRRIEYPRDIEKRPLIEIRNLDLSGVRITMLGIGQGIDPEPRIKLEQRWDNWLRKAKATDITLRRL